MEIIAVAAVGENGVIGDGDRLPWHLPHESRRYRERVADDTVVLGRKTFEMFEELPGARQLVLSRSERSFEAETATHAASVDAAIDLARERGDPVLYVLGGAGVYEAFLPRYDRMLLSRVDGEYEGDATFPAFDREAWTLVDETPYDGYTLETWEPAA
ncbi:dihydrofolate reductase [Halomicrobium mukohataei]|uniref:dihydrofolate reductase n=1 Tax=Halomicrobium mukohataei TaxID=57705 RepID=A0A847UBE7_9EURY|nr:dihydrofolate reductase [Halomicrobium mukohataei]NLV09796.1 dihydrofolate reductase [Halomicrobium mukohataei]